MHWQTGAGWIGPGRRGGMLGVLGARHMKAGLERGAGWYEFDTLIVRFAPPLFRESSPAHGWIT